MVSVRTAAVLALFATVGGVECGGTVPRGTVASAPDAAWAPALPAPSTARRGAAVDVSQFGASGDGVTDDRRAIQDAIDRVHAAGGGTVRVPPGTYRCVGGIVLTNGVQLSGTGSPSRMNLTASPTRLSLVGGGSLIAIRTPDSTSDVAVTDLELDGSSSSEGSNGVSIEASGGSAAAGIRFERVTIRDFKDHQVYQNGTVFDVTFRDCTFHNYGNTTAGDLVHVGPDGTPGQITFDNCWFILNSRGRWSFRNDAAVTVRFLGGTVGPNDPDANGVQVVGGLTLYGTHLEGRPGSTTSVGVRYVGSTGAVISPSACIGFGRNVEIGDGTARTARGWNLNGAVGGYNPGGGGDVVITAGGPRAGVIGEIGFVAGSRTIVDQRADLDGVHEVTQLDRPGVDGTFAPAVEGTDVAGTPTYDVAVTRGAYTRVGNLVTFALRVKWTAAGGASGALRVTGLPLAPSAVIPGTGQVRRESIPMTAGSTLQFVILTSPSFVLEEVSASGVISNVPFSPSGDLIVTGQYYL